MKCRKGAGALVSPRHITVYSKWPKQDQNAVSHFAPFVILTRFCALRRFSCVNRLALDSLIKVSEISGRRYWFFTVISLIPQQATQSVNDPSSFLMNNTSTPAGEELALINPLDKFSSMYLLSTISSS